MSAEENIKINLCRLCTKSAESAAENDLFDKCNKFMLQQIKDLTGLTLKDLPAQMLPRHFCNKCKEELPRACDYRRLVIMSQNFFKSKDFKNSFQYSNEEQQSTTDECKSQLFDTVYVSNKSAAALDEIGFEQKETESEDDFVWAENTPAECVETLIDDIKSERFDDDDDTSNSNSHDKFSVHQNFINENSIAENIEEQEATTTAANLNPIKEEFPTETKQKTKTKKTYKTKKDKKTNEKVKVKEKQKQTTPMPPKVKREKKAKEKEAPKDKMPKERKPRVADPDKKLFVCEQCGASFFSKPGLVAHLLRHTGERKFACEICEVKFFSIYELQRHIRFHTGEAPYQCRHCERRFRDYSHRQRHERSKHLNVRPFACTLCDKTFTNNYIAKNHMLTHTKLRQFECKVCEKYFLRQTHLFTHYRSVTHKNNAAKYEKQDESLPIQAATTTDIWNSDIMLKALANQQAASLSENLHATEANVNQHATGMSTNLPTTSLSSSNHQISDISSNQATAGMSTNLQATGISINTTSNEN